LTFNKFKKIKLKEDKIKDNMKSVNSLKKFSQNKYMMERLNTENKKEY
jgi:hypothetical protein